MLLFESGLRVFEDFKIRFAMFFVVENSLRAANALALRGFPCIHSAMRFICVFFEAGFGNAFDISGPYLKGPDFFCGSAFA